MRKYNNTKYSDVFIHRVQLCKTNSGVSSEIQACCDYIHIKKMEYAKALLRDKRMSIQDVSERLGYCLRSCFLEMFRRYVKLSPSEYLAQFEGKSNL